MFDWLPWTGMVTFLEQSASHCVEIFTNNKMFAAKCVSIFKNIYIYILFSQAIKIKQQGSFHEQKAPGTGLALCAWSVFSILHMTHIQLLGSKSSCENHLMVDKNSEQHPVHCITGTSKPCVLLFVCLLNYCAFSFSKFAVF